MKDRTSFVLYALDLPIHCAFCFGGSFAVYVTLSFSVRVKQANASLKRLLIGVLVANVRRDCIPMKKLPILSLCQRLKIEGVGWLLFITFIITAIHFSFIS